MSIDYKVKWHDHDSVFFRSMESFCRNQVLTDVTLSCDQTDFQAHKLILSGYSGYFQRLFSLPSANPTVVFLKDVPARHMELILAFMYRGEIMIKASEMKEFMESAISLQVSGLTQVENLVQLGPIFEGETHPAEEGHPGVHAQSSRKKRKAGDVGQIPSDPQFSPNQIETPSPSPPGDPTVRQQFISDQMEILKAAVQMADQGVNKSTASSSSRQTLSSADRPTKYMCQFCDKNFNDRWRLDRHTVSHTGEQRFTCNVCCKKFSTHDSCVRHLRNMHKEEIKHYINIAELVKVAKNPE